MLSRISKKLIQQNKLSITRKSMNPAAGINSGLRVLRSQSQQAYEEPLITRENEKLRELKDEEKKMEKKRNEEVKKEQDVRETLEDDDVDLASYDSFPASDPPSTEMSS